MAAGYLTAGGFDLVAADTYASQLLGELMQRLAVAECLQWRLRRRPLGLKYWESIASEDTGSMFKMCAGSAPATDGWGRSGVCSVCCTTAATMLPTSGEPPRWVAVARKTCGTAS